MCAGCVFNLILIVALAMATIGSLIKIKGGVIDKVFTKPSTIPVPTGTTEAEGPSENNE